MCFFYFYAQRFWKLLKKYLIEQKNAKKQLALLAPLQLSLYYGRTLR